MPETELPDSILVVRCQLGDRDAWDLLVRRWHPRLWRFVSGMLLDRPTAEDVNQNIWLRVTRSLVRLRHPESLSAWLYGVARAAIADRLREQYRHPSSDNVVELSEADTGFEMIDNRDLIRSGLAQLQPPDREVVLLYYLHGCSLDEVARCCDIPPGTVKSRLHRARRVLRQTLEDKGTDDAA